MTALTTLPFSKIRISRGLVFLAGEMPFEADGSIPSGIAAQTHLTLARVSATLATVDLCLDDIVSATVFLTHKEDFAEFNQAYASHFKGLLPVRATVCADLMVPARIEISVIAATRA